MPDDLNDNERDLVAKIAESTEADARPQVHGAGWYGDVLNFVAKKVPVHVIRGALIVFIGYEAFEYYSKAQLAVADLVTKRAQVNQTEAEAAALRGKIGSDTAELARLKAELERLEADAASADADARAQAQHIGSDSARLATIRAEIETANAEAARVQSEVAAQNQNIDGLPLVVAKKKNEVEAAETEIEQSVWSEHLYIEGLKRGDWRTYFMGGLLGRSAEEDGIKRYPITQIFNELHSQVR
jgi:hypothetical protein